MIEFHVNNEPVSFSGDEDTPLLWILRDHLGLTGTKYGCGIGSCGACTVHIDGLSTALNLEITVEEGQVVQSNFHDYRIARMSQMPAVLETHILSFGDKPTGMGEMGLPSVAPALTNAIFNACGVRIRKLPLRDQLKKALA